MLSQRRAFLLLGLSVIIGALASVAAYSWLQDLASQAQNTQAGNPSTETVAVAAQDLSPGLTLTEDMAQVLPYPSDHLPEGAFRETAPLKGRVLLWAVKRDEPILESKLAPQTVTTGGIAAVTHPDRRAMAVRVEDLSIAGLLKPGDRVDVMVTMHRLEGTGDPVTKLILQHVLVLPSRADLDNKKDDPKPEGEQATSAKIIMLEVAPEEAEKLALATTEGKVQLALRNPVNADPVLTKGATVGSLLASYGGEGGEKEQSKEPTPQPGRRTPKPRVKPVSLDPARDRPPVIVEVIKGVARTDMRFEAR